LLKIQGYLGAADSDQLSATALGRGAPAKDFSTTFAATWALPLLLGTISALAALVLVFVELAQPPREDGFGGIRFSNAVNSSGSRHISAMFRDHLAWLPRPFADEPLSPNGYVWGLRLAWLTMIAVQIAAIIAVRQTRSTSLTPWAIGPALTAFVLLFYPPSSTDVYAYASFGWVADQGKNPYLRSPHSLHGDPFRRFNDWTDIRTPYGPVWTQISRAIVHFSGDEPFTTTLGFKLVATVAAFGLALVAYHLAQRVTNRADLALLVFIFVWWSPVLITESAATVHLDSLMMLLAMAGLACATATRWRSYRFGVALIAASVLIKPVSLPLLGLMILGRLASPARLPVVLKRIALDSLVASGIIAAGYAPFWDRSLPRAMYENDKMLYATDALHSTPLWMWALAHVDTEFGLTDAIHGDPATATRWVAIVFLLIVAACFVRGLVRQRRAFADAAESAIAPATLKFMLLAWAGVTVILCELPVNAHPWYTIWSLVPLGLLGVSDGLRARERPPTWLYVLQGWILLSFWIYHTLPKT
jgi:hypothetical protein